MDAARWIGRAIAMLVVASLVGGCGSAGATSAISSTAAPTPTTTTSGTPLPTPTALATPTPAPTVATYGPVSVVTGSETCGIDFGTVTGEGTPVQHARDGTARCTDTVNDPRVSGTYTATWNLDYWGTPDKLNGALVQWGTGRLTTAGGAWEGRATGVYSADRGDTIVWWWTGTGAYAGLTYFQLATGRGPWTIQGQIVPGLPPKP